MVSRNTQGRGSVTGKLFEEFCDVLFSRVLLLRSYERNCIIPEAAMAKRVNGADFAFLDGGKVSVVIEVKGSPEFGPGGEQLTYRPGALRTDTVKKAIATGYQVKRASQFENKKLASNPLFYIVTNTFTDAEETVKKMIDLARRHGSDDRFSLVDDIFVVTNCDDLHRLQARLS